MKICFFSDIHGNIEALNSFWENVRQFNVDMFVFGGDIFGYYYHQIEVMDFLLENKINCLLGNHDRMFLDLLEGKIDEQYLVNRYGSSYKDIKNHVAQKYIDFLYGLKSRNDFKVDGLNLAFVHGSLLDPLNGRIYPDAKFDDISIYDGIDVVFMAHTHHKFVKKLHNGTLLINPGSVGQQRDGKGTSYCIFDTNTLEFALNVFEYDKEKLISEIKSRNEEKDMELRLMEVLLRKKVL